MIKEEEVYKIGKLGKTHGVKGEISFLFDDDVFDRVDADYLVLMIDGILVPFFMEEYRFRSNATAIVGYDIIDANSGKPVGRIASVDDTTLNILFCLEDGQLIPASEDLITGLDKENKQITINIPEGLLDL